MRIRDALRLLRGKAERVPASPGVAFPAFAFGGGQSSGPALSMMESSPWLFAVIDRIATALAAVPWELYAGERLLDRHPLLNLWRSVNAFYTQEEFLETGQQHFELTGETWWLLVREGKTGPPVEMWPLRPDRMTPVPDAREYLKGYIYKLGNETIPLAVNDVVHIRRPSPADPYRGIGVIKGLMPDMDAERLSAAWTASFFRNSAEPGGIIEFDADLDDPTFERLRTRWQLQHQGVANAHRVALLERGRWVDRKYTQADMQFAQLRSLNRDLILGAFGMPKSVMGITEDVNRANAEAGEITFSRWVLGPRLRRIRAALNERLCPLFGPGLHFEYVDPTPVDRQALAVIGASGYNSGILRLDEARARYGADAIGGPEGEAFKAPPPAPVFGGGNGGLAQQQGLRRKEDSPTALFDTPLRKAERAMRREWGRRLAAELDGLIAHLERSKAVVKLEPGDVAGYAWDWWAKYGEAVIAELTEAWAAAALADNPELTPGDVQRLAREWATVRGGQLLRLDGDISITEATRARVNAIVGAGVEEGQSLGQIAKLLREDVIFSKGRAETVARTETATALGQGQKGSALLQGRDEKHWVTQGSNDPRVDEACLQNEEQGWIPIADAFASGHDTIPLHPNCMCVVRYRTAELHPAAATPARHAACGKLLMASRNPGRLYCRHCKVEVTS